MAAFLYFVADHKTPVTPELLTEWGLDHAFDDVPGGQGKQVPWHGEMIGPTGQAGTLLCDEPALKPMMPKYIADEQVWRQVPGKPEIWLGYYTAARPTEDDLVRDERVVGYGVKLADGYEWQVPLVRQVSEAGLAESALPTYVDFGDDGKPCRGRILEKYQRLAELAEPFWQAWYAGWSGAHERLDALGKEASDQEIDAAQRFSIDCESMVPDAIAILGFNYRVSLAEVAALELFRSDEGTIEVLKAACDIEAASLFLQKKTPDSAT